MRALRAAARARGAAQRRPLASAPASAFTAPTSGLAAPMLPPGGDGSVLFEELGSCRVAVLNRPAALNALDLSMVTQLHALYAGWADAPHVGAVLLRGTGRAFCAGGDVKALATAPGPFDARRAAAAAYFRAEDALVWRIATLAKPHVALLDGLVFGGGAGVSINGAMRVATERTVFAMPECAIGFFPDGAH